MKISAVVSTKGGVGKTTIEANLGAFCADAGLRVLLIDLDPAQPSLSSYYQLVDEAQGGIYDLLAFNITESAKIISSTAIPNLSLVISNDINNQLNSLLLQAPDGRLRLANLMPSFKDHFDLVLIDTQGARSAMLEMVVLASDLVISPTSAQYARCTGVQPGNHADVGRPARLWAPGHENPTRADSRQQSRPNH